MFWAVIQISTHRPLLKKCAVVIASVYPSYCHQIQYQFSSFCGEIRKGEIRKKMNTLRDLKSSCHRYLPASCQKRFCKIKNSFQGSILNVDLCSIPGCKHLFYIWFQFFTRFKICYCKVFILKKKRLNSF